MTQHYSEDAKEFLKTLPDYQCSCSHCATMCKHTPCLPTPEEAIKIIENGHADRLTIYDLVGSANVEDRTDVLMPSIKGNEDLYFSSHTLGKCTFLTEEGLCEIHNIKPSEGKKVVCHTSSKYDIRDISIRTWECKEGSDVIKQWEKITIKEALL